MPCTIGPSSRAGKNVSAPTSTTVPISSTTNVGVSVRIVPRPAGAARLQLDTLRLLVTELITNAVRHAGCRTWIELGVEIYPDSVRAEVLDCGSGFQPPERPEPHRDRTGGWGLCLVDQLADRWGVAPDDVTRVWFELGRSHSRGFAPA